MNLINDLYAGVVLGIGAYGAMLALVFAMQTVSMVADGRRLSTAIPRSAGRTWALVGATFTALAMLFTTGAGVVDVVTNGVVSAPIAASNLVTLGLGVLGIQGLLTGRAFVIGALAFIGFTVVMKEVRG